MSNELLKGDAKKLGFVHPESRKAAQLSRVQRKETNKGLREKQKNRDKIDHGQFFRWLKGRVDSEENAQKKNFTYAEIAAILGEWASRYDDELEDLKASEKKKTRELEVELLVQEERQKLRTGYLAPDLRVNKVVRELRDWDGKDFDFLAKFKMVPFKELKPDMMDESD